MESRITRLLEDIRQLEDELEEALRTQELKFHYRLAGTRVKFEAAVRKTHGQLRVNVFRWLGASRLRNVVSAPFIYAMIIPFVLLDLFLAVYQAVCFPLYGIAKVQRGKYIALDRHRLGYLNAIEKLNCLYCGYANGVIAWAREIAARTEQYWCPVKHARKILDPHRRYARFADFGDAEAYPEVLRKSREALRKGHA